MNVFKGDLTAEAGKVYDYTEVTGNVNALIYKSGADGAQVFREFFAVAVAK